MNKKFYLAGMLLSMAAFIIITITMAYQGIRRQNAENQLNQLAAETQGLIDDSSGATFTNSAPGIPKDSSLAKGEESLPLKNPESAPTASKDSMSKSTESEDTSSSAELKADSQDSSLPADTVPALTAELDNESPADSVQTVDIISERGITIPEKNINWDDFHNQNPDIYAWIYVPNTHIDYPVLQHPTEKSYYLTHNLDHSEGYPGCIYTHNVNSKDWTDPNTVIYGHNMNNGSMFHDLHKFEDGDFFNASQFIFIYTPDGTKVYEVFASYPFPNVDLNMCFDYSTPDAAQMYFDGIWTNTGWTSHFRDSITLDGNSKIVTMTTCIGGQPDMRYLVQGVLLNP